MVVVNGNARNPQLKTNHFFANNEQVTIHPVKFAPNKRSNKIDHVKISSENDPFNSKYLYQPIVIIY